MMLSNLYMKTADGYLKLDAWERIRIYAACMPWGVPFGLYATKGGAKQACLMADQSKEMVGFREMNEELGITWKYGPCRIIPLYVPPLVMLIPMNGKVVKNSQVYELLQSELGVLEREVPDIKQQWLDKYTK